MEGRKRLVGDITSGYMLMDEDEATKAGMVCDTIGRYLGINKTDYTRAPKTGMRFFCPFEIRKVIFNNPATIVYWEDGTKTIVKSKGEKFDPEKGLAMAITKKALGNKGNYYNLIKKWTNQYSEVK